MIDDTHLIDRYGTGDAGAGRNVVRRKGRPSAKCLLVSSAIATLLLVGALVEVQRRPAVTGPGAHSTADAVAKLFTEAGVQKLSLTAAELEALPPDVLPALNATADPCDDFYEFSCGGWIAKTTIPAWQSSWAKQWDGVTTDVEKNAVKALQADKGPGGTFFRSCMDTPTIQKLGKVLFSFDLMLQQFPPFKILGCSGSALWLLSSCRPGHFVLI